ncbi:response regulator transcription factor [Ottowia pentelensis]|uniref:Response regulator transcription factor n=1 Tax=Ottowia pentelensis TaxID=511108 RepID=A0ABV6PNS4_9BURK
MATLTLDALSTLLRQLYVASRCGDVEQYQRRALRIIAEQIAFDAAWWGRGSFGRGMHDVHCSHTFRLPADIADRLNLSDPDNIVAQRVVSDPGRAHYFGLQELRSQPSTAALTEHMGIEQSICVADVDAALGVSGFVSLVRRNATPRFSARDLKTLERLAPHLAAGLEMALADELAAQRNPERTVLLATDTLGLLRVGEPATAETLQLEWPGWTGPQLPKPLVERIVARQREFLGRHLHATIRWIGDRAFVSMRRRELRDMLTRRERDVANAFAAGQSYREVAELLGLSPATVRHHLRSVYVKLGVTDKASFAMRLGSQTSSTG